MQIKVKEWDIVASWHWDLRESAGGDELCGICRVPFEGTCPSCKYPGTGCPLILGDGCTHNFHLHCILKWLEQESSKGLCPMCRQVFVYKKDKRMEYSKELENLQLMIDGHRDIREGEREDREFDSYDEDLRMAE